MIDHGITFWAAGGDNDFLDILPNLSSFEQILHYMQSNQGQGTLNSKVSLVHLKTDTVI